MLASNNKTHLWMSDILESDLHKLEGFNCRITKLGSGLYFASMCMDDFDFAAQQDLFTNWNYKSNLTCFCDFLNLFEKY